jgi:PAS domain S-box-containing protein
MTGRRRPTPEQKMTHEQTAARPLILSTTPLNQGDNRRLLAVVGLSLLIFLAAVPFARMPLPQIWTFIPIYQSALIISDLITALLLFTQFTIDRSRALLVLACGYLFTAAMAVVHLVTFPGLFSPTGLLGAGPQTTAWLYMFWHAVFPLTVTAYALLKHRNGAMPDPSRLPRHLCVAAGAAVALATAGVLALVATLGSALLPDIMQGNGYTPAMILVVSAVWVASVPALIALWIRRPHTKLDMWLMVVMCAWFFDMALGAVFNAGRFDLGFYLGRIYGLLAATVVLVGLLLEMGALHARLTRLFEAGQQALRHEIEENSRIFETSLDLIMITDRRGKIVRVSPSARAILGYDANEMVARGGGDFVYSDDLDAVRDEMRMARRGKLTRHFDTRYVHKDGRVVALAWSGVWSEPEQRHFFIGRDMTESKKAREALLDSEQMALGIIDTAIDGFIQFDAAGIVLDWNRQSETMFGHARDEVVGRRFAEFGIPADIRDGFPQRLARFVQASRLSVPVQRYETRALRRDGSEFPVEVSMTALRRGDGYVLNAFVRDLTEKIRIEEQFRQAQKMEAVGQLTGGLAHDFNNLLAIIIGNLDVLSELRELDSEQEELLHGAIGAALSGSELTRRLLAFARRQPLQPESIDLNELISEIGKLLSRTLGENIDVKFDLDRTIPQVVADQAQLGTAIANLANNARDAMPGGGRLHIATRNARLDEAYAAQHVEVEPGDYVAIEISDTGEGMPPEVLERIFEPFFTTKPVGKGTGLGLSMVFGFMKQSRGHINVYSEPGHGTTFRLYLRPAVPSPEQPVMKAPPTQLTVDTSATVLVVEDNRRLREVVVKQLTSLRFAVLEAANAQEALERLDCTRTVDLVFSDVVLPGGMDGIALTREVVKRYPDTKILLTSGFPGKQLVEAAGLGETVRLLSKPYRKDESCGKSWTSVAWPLAIFHKIPPTRDMRGS